MSNQTGRTLGRRRLEESSASASGSKSERPVRAYLGEIYRFLFLFIIVTIVIIVIIVVIVIIVKIARIEPLSYSFAGMSASLSPPEAPAARPLGDQDSALKHR